MKPWKELKDLPVIEQASGKRIGRIEQIWLHAGGRQMQGISIRGRGLRGGKLYASMGDIRLLGEVSAIVSKVRALPTEGLSWKLQEARVYGADGERIGWLTNALIDEDTGNVTALEVSRGYFDDLLGGREWVREFTFRQSGVIAVINEA